MQSEFTYSACEPFTKSNIVKGFKKQNKIKKETGNLNHICNNKTDKSCFAHDAKYLAKRT